MAIHRKQFVYLVTWMGNDKSQNGSKVTDNFLQTVQDKVLFSCPMNTLETADSWKEVAQALSPASLHGDQHNI